MKKEEELYSKENEQIRSELSNVKKGMRNVRSQTKVIIDIIKYSSNITKQILFIRMLKAFYHTQNQLIIQTEN